MKPILELENLTKRYPTFTLDDISLCLPSGCILGFIGENGAGKSTTINLMLDIVHKDGGQVRLFGKTPDKNAKEHIGVVLDECCFPENLTAKDANAILQNMYETWNAEVFFRYLDRFRLPPHQRLKDYSKGMKMKLSFAVARSHDTKLMILDEATSGLDPIVREEILDELLDFIQDETHGVFMSSHITSDLEKVCDYIAFIHRGKLLFMEPKDELLEKYGVLKCTKEDLEAVDPAAIRGCRQGSFGVEALVLRDRVPRHLTIDSANLEDIMLYFVKEGKTR